MRKKRMYRNTCTYIRNDFVFCDGDIIYLNISLWLLHKSKESVMVSILNSSRNKSSSRLIFSMSMNRGLTDQVEWRFVVIAKTKSSQGQKKCSTSPPQPQPNYNFALSTECVLWEFSGISLFSSWVINIFKIFHEK